MPRVRRFELAGVAQHVVQRGNDRQPCFFREIDCIRYLQDLREAALRYQCQVHAYVLMTNHVHLLATPGSPSGISKMMQAVGRRYVRYVNDSLCRTGTLWEGRYKSCLVDNEDYVLACYRYIELNPVRAGMTAAVGDYRWSSHAANGYAQHDPLVTPHTAYASLSKDVAERCRRYREIVAEGIRADELETIRLYAQRQRALGSDRFQIAIERQLGRRAGLGQPGRPRKPLPEP